MSSLDHLEVKILFLSGVTYVLLVSPGCKEITDINIEEPGTVFFEEDFERRIFL